jgi:hypothetical protein
VTNSKKRERPETALLRELAAWGGTFRPGLEQRRVVRTDDGLEVEISIRVRRYTGAAEAAQLREEVLAYLRSSPFGYPNAHEAERCGCYLNSGARCEGKRVVAVVVYSGGLARLRGEEGTGHCFRFICGRHRQTHGVDPARVVGVVELSEHSLAEARDIMKRQRAEEEARRKALIAEHRQGAHGLLPAGAVLAKRCPECDELEHELSRCRSNSPNGSRCSEDQGHAGPHRLGWREQWSSGEAVKS